MLKKHKFQETEQTRYGKELHKAAERYVKGGPLAAQFSFMQPTLDALKAKRGTKHTELQLALDVNLKPCKWFDKELVWVRGIIDLLILDGDVAWVIDYKTGSNKYPDKDQLDLMALLTFAHYPDVKKVNAGLLFVVKETMTKHKVEVENAESIWWDYRERVAKIEAAHTNNVWNPTQSGLCPWCPVKTCEFHPEH